RWVPTPAGCVSSTPEAARDRKSRSSVDLGLLRCPGLLLALHEEGGEVDRIEQERRKAALAREVGDEAAQEREQQRRAVDQQKRLQRLLGHGGDFEQPGIGQLQVVDHAGLARRLRLEEDGAL